MNKIRKLGEDVFQFAESTECVFVTKPSRQVLWSLDLFFLSGELIYLTYGPVNNVFFLAASDSP